MEIEDFVQLLAEGIAQADAAGPTALSKRSGTPYQPGIGPHTEGETVTLALNALPVGQLPPLEREVPYPRVARSRCDVVFGGQQPWAIELKMLRLMGDNGKPNDNMLMHILSPYPAHRSAVTDCAKLARSGFSQRKAIVIFGYDYEHWGMDPAIAAFEVLAQQTVALRPVPPAKFQGLVHPVHRAGRVFGWEVL